MRTIKIGRVVAASRVPAPLQQGAFLLPQSVSAMDISQDDRFIAVTTMAFRNDRNFWLLSEEGQSLWGRYVLPWAPFEAAVLPGGGAFGVGLAYSRVTSPAPTISLFQREGTKEMLVDLGGGCLSCQLGWLSYGAGDWRTGWVANIIGDLIVRGRDSVFTLCGKDGAWRLSGDGSRQNYPLSPQRPFRMTASADGASLALGYMAADPAHLDEKTSKELNISRTVLALRRPPATEESWRAEPVWDSPLASKLPEPAAEFPALADSFHMRPDALVPFRVAASVAVNRDASKVAITEYAGWLWVSHTPPDAGVVPFLPRQRGWLRIFGAAGSEIARMALPKEGLFEVQMDLRGSEVWCIPMRWFARGTAGRAWLPADPDANTLYIYDLTRRSWRAAWRFPDAVNDVGLHPGGGPVLVSCWDGGLYIVTSKGQVRARREVGGSALVRWGSEGRFAVVGLPGEVLRLDAGDVVRWSVKLPSVEPESLKQPLQPVFEEVPIYSVGRVGPEDAYAGDIWLIKTSKGGILVDGGGTSSIPLTLEKIRAAGMDPKRVRYLVHTHGHGDHTGAGYLWRTMGLKIVAAESAAFTLGWLMPMQAAYGIWVPRPVDVPLPLKRAGDETEITLCGLRIRALFAPGHSLDSVVYMMEFNGNRVAFTGDIGFSASNNILNRCWGDRDKAKVVADLVRSRLIPWRPDFVFTGHGSRRDGTQFLKDLVDATGL